MKKQLNTHNCVVVIPIYKDHPSKMESRSLKQCLKVLCNYDIVVVTHSQVDLSVYKNIAQQSDKQFRTELFDEYFFKGIKGYNALCLDKQFYQRFITRYKYMLIYQLDAWVFKDELQQWCDRGYDYVGSPFFFYHDIDHPTQIFSGVGNGGFSLRKIQYCIDLVNLPKFKPFLNPGKLYNQWKNRLRYSSNESKLKKSLLVFVYIAKIMGIKNSLNYFFKHTNEDYIFSDFAAGSFYIKPHLPTPEDASYFAFEQNPSYLFEKHLHQLPFGCHAFEKYEYRSFWSKYIP